MKTLIVVALLFGLAWGQTSSQPVKSTPQTTTATTPGGVDDQPRVVDSYKFVIGNDDVLVINVWKEPDLSRAVPVRSDGKISLPLVGEVQASGETPRELEQEIAQKLKNYITQPQVTVIVQQINSQKFNILGQVVRPGAYPLTNAITVLDAIAVAGGFRDFAKKKSLYILRANSDGNQTRIPFNYKDVITGKKPEQNVKLRPRDTIVVP